MLSKGDNLHNYNSSTDLDQFENELKAKLLEKALTRLEITSQNLTELMAEQERLKGFISTCKNFFEEEDNEDLVKKIELAFKKIKFVCANSEEGKRVFGHMIDAEATRPSLSETKDIARDLLKKLGSISTTSRFKELLRRDGYSVKLNSLRYVLSQSKDVFEYNPDKGGWIEKENSSISEKDSSRVLCVN
jgi:hypothetical protein